MPLKVRIVKDNKYRKLMNCTTELHLRKRTIYEMNENAMSCDYYLISYCVLNVCVPVSICFSSLKTFSTMNVCSNDVSFTVDWGGFNI